MKAGTVNESSKRHDTSSNDQVESTMTGATSAKPASPTIDAPLMDSFVAGVEVHGKALIQYGARIIVMREMLIAISAQMTPQNRDRFEKIFRIRVEDLLTVTDGRRLPHEFHSALLNEVNYYLKSICST